jgi:hypothetical protein
MERHGKAAMPAQNHSMIDHNLADHVPLGSCRLRDLEDVIPLDQENLVAWHTLLGLWSLNIANVINVAESPFVPFNLL